MFDRHRYIGDSDGAPPPVCKTATFWRATFPGIIERRCLISKAWESSFYRDAALNTEVERCGWIELLLKWTVGRRGGRVSTLNHAWLYAESKITAKIFVVLITTELNALNIIPFINLPYFYLLPILRERLCFNFAVVNCRMIHQRSTIPMSIYSAFSY